jgi:DNA-binding NtrC family response regulator
MVPSFRANAMIETFKRKLAQQLENAEVSLAMVFDRDGRILWHYGRSIRGTTIESGEGFSKHSIRRMLADNAACDEDDVLVSSSPDNLPQSARNLHLRSVLVRSMGGDLFLYADSGSRVAFDRADRRVLGLIGDLLGEALEGARHRSGRDGGLSGSSGAMQAVRDLVAKYALEDEPVLITGETGVGKTRVAELLHRVSGREGPFVVAEMPSIPEGLFESELFGHRRGAFTGAAEDRRGLVEEAQGGTLLLDEVADAPPALQAKLLRFIEARRYRVVGDPRERVADVRVIAATHRDLADEVRRERFREDLYFRLSVLQLRIPPLRERPEDVRALVSEHERRLRGKRVTDGFWDAMLSHTWPGNVRELIHVLTRAGVELDGDTIGKEIRDVIGAARSARRGPTSLDRALADLSTGRTFWETAWQAFLDRDLNRRELQAWLCERHRACGRSLKRMAASLNIADDEYPRFVSALHKYDVHPCRSEAIPDDSA